MVALLMITARTCACVSACSNSRTQQKKKTTSTTMTTTRFRDVERQSQATNIKPNSLFDTHLNSCMRLYTFTLCPVRVFDDACS